MLLLVALLGLGCSPPPAAPVATPPAKEAKPAAKFFTVENPGAAPLAPRRYAFTPGITELRVLRFKEATQRTDEDGTPQGSESPAIAVRLDLTARPPKPGHTGVLVEMKMVDIGSAAEKLEG